MSNFDQRLHALLGALGLVPLLDVVVLPADAGAAKPDAQIIGHALARLGVRADEVVYVGDDAEHDIAVTTACRLGGRQWGEGCV